MALLTRRAPFPVWNPLAELETLPAAMRRFFEGVEPYPFVKEKLG